MKITLLFLIVISLSGVQAQTNMLLTNPEANNVLMGNYNPADYASSVVINDHLSIVQGLNADVNPDSLKSYIIQMSTFNNRNTGSDTVSLTNGIGAARKWAYNKFEEFSAANENRLVVSYFQFDQVICTIGQHKNILAVLPGTDTSNHEILIIEGHLDSRCQSVCDTACLAQGIEDNASGSALVLELARVMSQYTYKNTIVFMLTIGEEQGLYGAGAFSQYCLDNALPIKAVFNNDVIGGVICGATSSSPSCPGLNDIDSTHVRFFSQGGFNSANKQLARFVKLEYQEELKPSVAVPMDLLIMSGEDRIGRGGDHIPFRQDGFTAMRFTSANEHGDASNGSGYTDRQHTSDDILGVDTNSDMIIDSFFVDFNYLARNAVINGVGSSMAGIGPRTPDFAYYTTTDPGIIIKITDQTQYPQYRIAVRTNFNDWDSVYVMNTIHDTIYPPVSTWYYVSVASVDDDGVESLFSYEIAIHISELGIETVEELPTKAFELLQNHPNPFDESTIITVYAKDPGEKHEAHIEIRDLSGKLIESLPLQLDHQMNEVIYEHGYGMTGTFLYTLYIDGVAINTKKMVFAN